LLLVTQYHNIFYPTENSYVEEIFFLHFSANKTIHIFHVEFSIDSCDIRLSQDQCFLKLTLH